MEELMKISYESGQPTVSARELHEGLDIKTPYTMWFERMAEYGFTDGKDFFTKMLESTGGRPSVDHAMTVDMAKQICMIQRTEQGRTYRQYLLDLEKAWNTPEQVFARALKMADQTINRLQSDITRMRPKEIFADAVTASHTSILVGDMAKLLK